MARARESNVYNKPGGKVSAPIWNTSVKQNNIPKYNGPTVYGHSSVMATQMPYSNVPLPRSSLYNVLPSYPVQSNPKPKSNADTGYNHELMGASPWSGIPIPRGSLFSTVPGTTQIVEGQPNASYRTTENPSPSAPAYNPIFPIIRYQEDAASHQKVPIDYAQSSGVSSIYKTLAEMGAYPEGWLEEYDPYPWLSNGDYTQLPTGGGSTITDPNTGQEVFVPTWGGGGYSPKSYFRDNGLINWRI